MPTRIRCVFELSLVAVAILCMPALGSAAPITTYYDVTVAQRYDFNNTSADFVAIDPVQFVLSMTFNDEVVFSAINSRGYGLPTFEGIPDSLVIPASVASATLQVSDVGVTATPQGITGNAYQVNFFRTVTATGTSTQLYDLQLASLVPVPGALDHTAFSDAFGDYFVFIMRGFDVAYDSTLNNETYSPDSFAYRGIAPQVLTATPVPEPGTLALLGTGFGLCVLRAARRQLNGHRG